VRGFLCPTLEPGEFVVLDNLSSHKVSGVAEAIQATGATLLYLPPYSPDFNLIEKFVSKLQAQLRKAAKRSIDALWEEIRDLLNARLRCTAQKKTPSRPRFPRRDGGLAARRRRGRCNWVGCRIGD
jgi:transposase